MKTINLILLVNLFLSFTYLTKAQSDEYVKGYFITTELDTIAGFIKDEKRSKLQHGFFFKRQKIAKIEKITTDEAVAFFISPYFHFQAISFEDNGKNEKRFLRKLVTGPVSLFHQREGNDQYIFIKQSGEQLQVAKIDKKEGGVIIKDNKYVGQIKYFLRDCPKVATIKSISWKKTDLIEIVNNHNNCIDPNLSSINLNQKRKLKIKGGFLLGLRNLNVSILNLIQPLRPYDNDIVVGQFGGLVSIAYFRKISLETGIVYNTYSTETQLEFTLGDKEVAHQIKTLEIPLNLRYNLGGSKFIPFLIGGARFGHFLNGNMNIISTSLTSSASEEQFDLTFDRVSGFNIGLGVSYQFNARIEGNLELSYNRLGIKTNVREDIVIKGISLNAKIYF